MKRNIAFILGLLAAVFVMNAAPVVAKSDTVVHFKKKIVHIQDSTGQVRVKVLSEDSVPYNKVYEGVFSDGKTYEKYTVVEEIGLDIPILNKMINKKKKKSYEMEPHWAGIGWGFANVADANFNINDIDGLSLKSQSSSEFYLNLFEKIMPVVGNCFGVTTGLGMGWHNYHLAGSKHLYDNKGVTVIEETNYKYDFNRLRTFQFTVPLLLEWQPTFQNDHKTYVSVGAIGCINTYSSYKEEYIGSDGGKIKTATKGMNVIPVSVDFMAQIGHGSFGLYAKYSPFSIFEGGKGPNVRGVSLGATLNF
jgi:hypothetical protein